MCRLAIAGTSSLALLLHNASSFVRIERVMKLLLWHCSELNYRDTIPSDRPKGIATVQSEKKCGHFVDVLVIFVSIEDIDTEHEVDEATDSIISTLDMLGCRKEVVVVPFAHLSQALAQPQKAVLLIADLEKRLESYGIAATVASFGYHKEFSLYYRAFGHPGSVAFRSLPKVGHS